DVAIARIFVRERTHVAGTLHVVLAAHGVHPHAAPADIASGHGAVGHAHDHGRALAVFGDAEAVVGGGIAAGGVEAGGVASVLRRHAGDPGDGFGAVVIKGYERRPALEFVPVATLAD